jgi:hypothetical protein
MTDTERRQLVASIVRDIRADSDRFRDYAINQSAIGNALEARGLDAIAFTLRNAALTIAKKYGAEIT